MIIININLGVKNENTIWNSLASSNNWFCLLD